MTVSVVNGYLCYSSCDEVKARAGKDPHPKLDERLTRGDARAPDSPAVTYGGALATRNAVKPADASFAAEGGRLPVQASSIDILA